MKFGISSYDEFRIGNLIGYGLRALLLPVAFTTCIVFTVQIVNGNFENHFDLKILIPYPFLGQLIFICQIWSIIEFTLDVHESFSSCNST